MTQLNQRFTHTGSRGTGYKVLDTERDETGDHVYSTLDDVRAVVDGRNEAYACELIRDVVIYNWVQESEDFEEQDEDGQRNHVFLTLRRLARLAGMDEGRIDAEMTARVQKAVDKATEQIRYSVEVDVETGNFFIYDNLRAKPVDPENQYGERDAAEAALAKIRRES